MRSNLPHRHHAPTTRQSDSSFDSGSLPAIPSPTSDTYGSTRRHWLQRTGIGLALLGGTGSLAAWKAEQWSISAFERRNGTSKNPVFPPLQFNAEYFPRAIQSVWMEDIGNFSLATTRLTELHADNGHGLPLGKLQTKLDQLEERLGNVTASTSHHKHMSPSNLLELRSIHRDYAVLRRMFVPLSTQMHRVTLQSPVSNTDSVSVSDEIAMARRLVERVTQKALPDEIRFSIIEGGDLSQSRARPRTGEITFAPSTNRINNLICCTHEIGHALSPLLGTKVLFGAPMLDIKSLHGFECGVFPREEAIAYCMAALAGTQITDEQDRALYLIALWLQHKHRIEMYIGGSRDPHDVGAALLDCLLVEDSPIIAWKRLNQEQRFEGAIVRRCDELPELFAEHKIVQTSYYNALHEAPVAIERLLALGETVRHSFCESGVCAEPLFAGGD